MTAGRLGGGGNGMSTEKPCDLVLSGFTTETITVLGAVAKTPRSVSVMTPGAGDMPPVAEQHIPGLCGWMITNASGMKLLPVMVNVVWRLCCVTFTLVIDGVGPDGGDG